MAERSQLTGTSESVANPSVDNAVQSTSDTPASRTHRSFEMSGGLPSETLNVLRMSEHSINSEPSAAPINNDNEPPTAPQIDDEYNNTPEENYSVDGIVPPTFDADHSPALQQEGTAVALQDDLEYALALQQEDDERYMQGLQTFERIVNQSTPEPA